MSVEGACENHCMQLLGKTVRYNEGGHDFIALITKVRDEERGIVNLAVFTENGCVARLGISPGDGVGNWSPIAASSFFDLSDFAVEVEKLCAQVAELTAQLAARDQVRITATLTPVSETAAPSSPAEQPAAVAPPPAE